MCKTLCKNEQLQRMADRSMARGRISLRDELVRLNDEELRRRENVDHQSCSDCLDEHEARRMITDLERDTRLFAVQRSYELPRTFYWAHYESACNSDSCPHGAFSLHAAQNLEPSRLKGLAKVIYEELSGPHYNFEVQIINTSTSERESFRLRITW